MQILTVLALALAASARSLEELNRRAPFTLKNGQDALALNAKFKTLSASSPCTENACVQQKFAQCVRGKFVVSPCGPGTICAALPLVNKAGTSITCTTQADVNSRIAATGAKAPSGNNNTGENKNGAGAGNNNPPSNNGGNKNEGSNNNTGGNNGNNNGSNNPQTSLTLDPAVIAKGFANNGQSVPVAGQVASLTSTNNYINFCKTVNLPLTNGAQVTGGSCNPAPMGVIPSNTRMPSSKFVFPLNLSKVKANTKFTVKMRIKNIETGNFVNAQQNYFSAPQQLNGQGIIRGHSHVVIEKLTSMQQTQVTDPTAFAFFKGLNDKAAGGILSADVDKGLPAGIYKLSSINTAANHQPVLGPVAQHGSFDDAVYFTVE